MDESLFIAFILTVELVVCICGVLIVDFFTRDEKR